MTSKRCSRLSPRIVSAVDSGNLAASLYCVHSGALELLKKPLLQEEWFSLRAANRSAQAGDWVEDELGRCRENWIRFADAYAPWLSPRFETLFQGATLVAQPEPLLLSKAAAYAAELEAKLATVAGSPRYRPWRQELSVLLLRLKGSDQSALQESRIDLRPGQCLCRRHAVWILSGEVAKASFHWLRLASRESSTGPATICWLRGENGFFLAVAKGDIDQESWFRLDRLTFSVKGRACLLSWTGNDVRVHDAGALDAALSKHIDYQLA